MRATRLLLGMKWQYALGEVILIVIGVTAALAVDEWRENIENTNVEAAFLNQLVADLQETENVFAKAVAVSVVPDDAARKLLRAFENDELVELETIRQILSISGRYSNPIPRFETADSLISSGNLRLIRDPTIRSEIIRFLNDYRDGWVVQLSQMEAEHRIAYRQVLDRAAVYGIFREDVDGIARRKSAPDIDAFLADIEAHSATTKLLNTRRWFALYKEGIGAEATRLRQLLERRISAD